MNDTKADLRVCQNLNCRKTFKPKRKWQRFCSDECRVMAWKEKNLAEAVHEKLAHHEKRIIELEKKRE